MAGYLDTLLGYQLRRASSAMIADLAGETARIGLSVPAVSVLFTIADAALADGPDGPGLSQSGIGRILGIKSANMAPLAALLEQNGLIRRHAVNGRSHALLLTDAGRCRLAKARQIVEVHEARFLADTSTEKRAQLVSLLSTIWRLSEDA